MTDILRAELERLFELDELIEMSRDLLGQDPEAVGGTAALATFARRLCEFSLEHDSLDALLEAVIAAKPGSQEKLAPLRQGGLDEDELPTGARVGELLIERKLAECPAGVAYAARRDGGEYRLTLIRREALRERRALHRFLTLTRLIARVAHPGLPPELAVGCEAERWFTLHRWTEGQPLIARLARSGPMHVNEARPLLRGILEPLMEMHERQLAHGALSVENVLMVREVDGNQRIMLLDPGTDRLQTRRLAGTSEHQQFPFVLASPRGLAPEQLKGYLPDARSDVYAFGALLYELITGYPVFGERGVEAAVGHLALEPAPPSSVAPRGWVTRELDEFVLRLLSKDPARRPADASDVLGELESLASGARARIESSIDDEELTRRIDVLIADPEDVDAALALESAVDEGADAGRIAEAFEMAADSLEGADQNREGKRRLLFRAARLHEAALRLDRAEQVYLMVLTLDPGNGPATAALESVRRRLGKYDELIEMLLKSSEEAPSHGERARAFAEIGRIYAKELGDNEQAVVAFTQAFCEDTSNASFAAEVEELAGNDQKRWEDVLSICVGATADPSLALETRDLILCQMADWYLDKVQRVDLSLPVYQAVLSTDPANDRALRGLTQIYRRAQQWPELGMILTTRADAAPTPALARDLRCEAAEILEFQLDDAGGARDIYEQIVADDPSHPRATEALVRIYDRTGDNEGLVKILLRKAAGESGEEAQKTLCRVAEIYELRLNDDPEAIAHYGSALELGESNLDALRGLDRLYSKTGRYRELLENLQKQIQLAATPRQRITLWERIAGIYDEEFLDHASAAAAWEAILQIDAAHDNALSSLPRHYRALDRWEELAKLYDRHAALAGEPGRQLELRLAEGRVLAEQIGSPDRAMRAYERALEIDPHHAGALEALARLRETVGDADAALSAILALAEKANTPEARAEQFVRAARLLESRADRDGAIEQYKRALDQVPTDVGISSALRAAYVARGDVNAAIQLIEKEFSHSEGEANRAKLSAQIALLARTRLKDDDRAEAAARRAIKHDPANLDARMILGDISFENGRYIEAASHYEVVADRADSIGKEDATRVLVRFVDALSKTGSTEQALAPMDTLLRIAPDNVDALARVAQVTFEHGAPKRAVELHRDLFERFGEIVGQDAGALFRYGEALRKSGDLPAAIERLEQAADQDPGNPRPLVALAQAYEQATDWERVIRTKTRHLDFADGEERVQLLIDIGEIATNKLADRTRAAKSYVAALEERPDDRRLLTRLMQLYSEEQDWEKLIEVVLRLAEFVDDTAQRAKYLQTAAIVASRQMKDFDRALEFYRQVIELDRSNDKAIGEAIELERVVGRFDEVEELLRLRLELHSKAEDKQKMLETFTDLGDLYERDLGWIDKAIDAFEAAQTLDPSNVQRAEKLSDLYASDPGKYLSKAVESQFALLRQNPYRAESYKLLRRLYTETKQADAAWCLCQALSVLNLSEPDEERFYKRMRSDTAAPARAAIEGDDWLTSLSHEDTDPLLTGIFALIEPAVIGNRSQSLEALGYDEHYRIDLARHPYPMSQNLFYAAGVLGMEAPPTYQNPNDPAGLSFLHAHTPSIVLGRAAMAAEIPPQAAAFIAARHLAYFRPGLYVRHLVPTGTGLKAWLFAAIKLISPQFPVAPELEGPVRDALAALELGTAGGARDQLARIVSRLIQSGKSLDLKRWVAGVDLTADRVGLLVSHDLETAVEIVKASDESASAVPRDERLKQLVLYSVSKPFFDLRTKLGIRIDS